ncbi:MAG: bifunctional riboflavin kinase/FAD synthetase [Prevotella sp.]|nr:bifunctional riboflavin kinase/FAD synthetase [Prevotella sp.]
MERIVTDRTTRIATPSVVTIGCFDGVHRGHQLLISQVMREARQRGMLAIAVTFDRQPRELFDASFHPELLTTQEEKGEALQQLGIDVMAILPFTRETADLSARAFMQQVLQQQLNARVLVTGYDNRFGHRTATQGHNEGFNDYVSYGEAMGMTVLRGDVARFDESDEAVSSSAIRRLLTAGDVAKAAKAMTRLYQLQGVVVSGEHIGRKLGFPTANLQPAEQKKLIPAPGVYAVWAEINGAHYPAMMNIGMRPTFDGQRQTLEVNILDFEGDLYGQRLSIQFVDRLRAERRFDSCEALAQQLASDAEQARQRLKT